MKRLAWMVGLLMFALSCQQDTPQKTTVVRPSRSGNGTAVSLKILQKRLASCMPGKNCPEELLRLAGLTHLRGLVEDTRHKDWILLGQEDPRDPPLLTGDIVVALRNAWMKYATRRENTLFYTPPACSIDPSPEVLARLERVTAPIQASGSFRAVAKILRLKTGGADLEYLLEEFPLEETPVPPTLPEISNVKEFRNVQENAGGRRLLRDRSGELRLLGFPLSELFQKAGKGWKIGSFSLEESKRRPP